MLANTIVYWCCTGAPGEINRVRRALRCASTKLRYEAWDMVASSDPDTQSGCGTSKAPGCIKAIVGNPALIAAYKKGIPFNGKAVPDGAAFAKSEWEKARSDVPYPVTVPGKLAEVSFMLKDAKRFPNTDGWGYATFRYSSSSNAWSVGHAENPQFDRTCHGCHTVVKASDFVFTEYQKR